MVGTPRPRPARQSSTLLTSGDWKREPWRATNKAPAEGESRRISFDIWRPGRRASRRLYSTFQAVKWQT